MKYSGIQWIGEIPDNWNVKAIRECLFERNEKNDQLQENTILSLSAKNGVTLYDGENHSGNKPREDLSGYKIVKKNDIVANSMNILSGSVGLSEYNGVVSPVYYIYHIRDSKDNIRYFNYIFQCNEFQKNLRRLGKGILIRETEDGKLNTIRTKVPSYQLSIEKIPYPNEHIQKCIVELLDKKTAEIDSLIEIENRQIEKLKEYKQAVITEAVTRGLDKNAPLKDSGVEWIGKIPECWKITSTKAIFEIIAGATPDSENTDNWDGNISWITPADYKTEDVFVNSGRRNLTQIGYDSCSTTLIPAGNIIFSKRAPIGLVAINNKELCTNQGCLSCVKKKNISVKYFYYQMSVYAEYYELFGSGTTFKEISALKFGAFKLVFPPKSVQEDITKYLDEKCENIARLIAIKQRKIEQLDEYKKSLIYEYVTGKKEVC